MHFRKLKKRLAAKCDIIFITVLITDKQIGLVMLPYYSGVRASMAWTIGWTWWKDTTKRIISLLQSKNLLASSVFEDT